MISIESYRAAIGKWHLFCIVRPIMDSTNVLLIMFVFYYTVIVGRSVKDRSHKTCIYFRLAVLLCLLLVICGSVQPNPGPVSDLSMTHVNMRSLQPHDRSIKIDELYGTLCLGKKCDIVCVSETWLDASIDNDLVSMTDYQLFRRDRDRHGGGVAIYAHDSLPVKHLTEFNIDGMETVCIEVLFLRRKVIVACMYRQAPRQ